MRIKFLTLTIQNQPALVPMIRELLTSFRKLRGRTLWKKNVDGGAFVIEVSGTPGHWHAHIHAVIIARFIPYFNLLLLWQKVSTGRGVFIQDIPKRAAVGYLTKYLSKPDAPEDVGLEIALSLRGVRLFAPIGSWFKMNRKYVRPPYPCKRCGGLKWFDLDVSLCNFNPYRFKEFDSGIPPPPQIAA